MWCFSPTTESYDQFPNFEVRGKTFKELVKKIFSRGERNCEKSNNYNRRNRGTYIPCSFGGTGRKKEMWIFFLWEAVQEWKRIWYRKREI